MQKLTQQDQGVWNKNIISRKQSTRTYDLIQHWIWLKTYPPILERANALTKYFPVISGLTLLSVPWLSLYSFDDFRLVLTPISYLLSLSKRLKLAVLLGEDNLP